MHGVMGLDLKKAFGLRLANGFEILLNDVKLESRAKIDATESLICRLKGGIDVTGNVKEEKKGRGVLDVYIKHVFVTTILVDPERRFGGWVNCNKLTPTTARNDIVKDNGGLYEEFLSHLRQYVARFPKVEEEVSRDEILIGNELDKMLRNYLKDMKLFPQGKLLSGRGTEPTLNKQNRSSPIQEAEESEKEPEYVKVHRNPKTNKPIKRTTKTNYGIIWLDQDYGNDKEPIFFVEPNIIVKNRTNNLYKFALRNKPSLGPKWLRLIPYLSRIAVTINPESTKWTHEQMFQKVDEATRYFLRQKDEL
jgi:hypothetical protein